MLLPAGSLFLIFLSEIDYASIFYSKLNYLPARQKRSKIAVYESNKNWVDKAFSTTGFL